MITLRIPTERVPLVNGERRIARALLIQYLRPVLIRYEGTDAVVWYADELPA